MAVKNKSEFESKYGAPPNELQNIAIGMKGGKAVYGTEMESKDTKGEGVINNTWSQNQAIMDSMFKEMGRSGGMYNPSASDIRRAEQLSPPTAADYKVTTRADGKQMVGAYSPEAAAMREPSSSAATDSQFLKTLKGLNEKPDMTSVFGGIDYSPATTAARAEKLKNTQTPVNPTPQVGSDNASVLKNTRKNNKGVDEEDLEVDYISPPKIRFDPMTGLSMMA